MPVAGSNRPLLLLTLLVFVGLFSLSRNHKDPVPEHASSSKSSKLAPTPALVNQVGERGSALTSGGARNEASSRTIQQRIIAVGAHPVVPLGTRDVIVLNSVVTSLAGDVHGDLAALMQILRRAQLVDLRGHWIGGQDILVQTGGKARTKASLLTPQAGSADTRAGATRKSDRYRRPRTRHDRHLPLLSDPEAAGRSRWWRPRLSARQPRAHELSRWQVGHHLATRVAQKIRANLDSPPPLPLRTDWRYVTKEDIASFGGERNRREAFSTGWIGQEFRTNYSITARVPYLIADDDFPASFAVQAPVLPKTPRGSSDRRFVGDPHVSPSFDAVANPFRLAAASFVHGGITPEYLASLPHDQPISEMNRIGHELLASLLAVPGHAPLGLPRTAPAEQREFWSERGPMWNRDWALEDEDEICERAEKACEVLRVRHLIQGHTPQFEGILSRCDGKILLIDTGA